MPGNQTLRGDKDKGFFTNASKLLSLNFMKTLGKLEGVVMATASVLVVTGADM